MTEPVPEIVNLLTARKKVLVQEIEEANIQHNIYEVRLYALMTELKALQAYLSMVENSATEKPPEKE